MKLNSTIDIIQNIQSKGKVTICKVQYNGTEVHAIHHVEYGYYLLFDPDERVLKKILRMFDTYRIDCFPKPGEAGFNFAFMERKRNGEKRVSVRTYLYSVYHSLKINDIRDWRIGLRNSTEKGVMDCRKANLYYAGGHNTDGFSIVERPCHEGEKYLLFSKDGRTEAMSYSDELYNLLTARCYCSGYTLNHRIILTYAYGKSDGKCATMNLCKLICYFNSYWKKFKKQIGAQKRFVHAYPKMRDECKGLDAGHVNSVNWNNCDGNLMFMERKDNQCMKDLIAQFVGEYKAFPLAVKKDGRDIILCHVTAFKQNRYYVFETVNDYLDFQKTMLGKTKLLEKLSITDFTGGNVRHIDTPKQAATAYIKEPSPGNVEQALPLLWKWCDERDALLKMYDESPNIFRVWKNAENGVNPLDMMNLIFPIATAAFN